MSAIPVLRVPPLYKEYDPVSFSCGEDELVSLEEAKEIVKACLRDQISENQKEIDRLEEEIAWRTERLEKIEKDALDGFYA